MAGAILKCRVCGKEYEACLSGKRIDGVFRWRDVACSPDHGAVYLDLIRKSRGIATTAEKVEEAYKIFDDEYMEDEDEDELSEFDFEDEDPDTDE